MSLSQDLLSHLDIVDVVSAYVSLKRVGKNYVGLSPFRSEKTPSFTVAPDKQIFKCFSTWIGGNAIKFVMEIERVDYRDAVKLLSEKYRFDLARYQNSSDHNQAIKKSEREKAKLLNTYALNFFREQLTQCDEAKQYLLTKRNLTQSQIDMFQLGYAPDNFYQLVQFLLSKGFSEQDCCDMGLAKKNAQGELYSFFRHRIIFPVIDTMGNVVWFGARALRPDDTPKYLNSPDTLLYDKSKILYGLSWAKQHLLDQQYLILVEGYMDVIGLAKLGIGTWIASCGTALSVDHMKILKRYSEKIIFLFDNDQAGFSATVRSLKLAYQQNIFPFVLKVPSWYKDVDERAMENPSQEQKNNWIESKQDWFHAVVEYLLSSHSMSSPVERQKVLQQLFEIIQSINNFALQDHYINVMAETFHSSYEVMFQQFKQFAKQQSFYARPQKEEPQSYQIDPLLLLQSLFFGDFLLLRLSADNQFYLLLRRIFDLIVQYDKRFQCDQGYDEDQQQYLLEAQLWREKEREHNVLVEYVVLIALQHFLEGIFFHIKKQMKPDEVMEFLRLRSQLVSYVRSSSKK